MEFLGSLGIDVKLLVAQTINFGLLLWLLTKFLYKPIIKRIEKDETELKQAQIQKEELEQQKKIFMEQKKREIAGAKKRAREIIKEVENMSIEMKKDIYKRAKKEAKAIIAQAENKIESLKPEIEKKVFKRMREEIGNSFEKSFKCVFSLSLQKEFQNVFWTDFMRQIEGLALQELKELNLVETLKKFNIATKEKSEKKGVEKKELEKIFAQKIGPLVLEYVHPLTTEQEEQLNEIVSGKIGIKLSIVKKQNRSLINGFRFEITGVIIESNLLNIIDNASNFKK